MNDCVNCGDRLDTTDAFLTGKCWYGGECTPTCICRECAKRRKALEALKSTSDERENRSQVDQD